MSGAEVIDIVIRCVQGYGHLPIVRIDGAEIYRGEFQTDEAVAHDRAVQALTTFEERRKV